MSGLFDPFGTGARTAGTDKANAALKAAADEFNLSTGKIDYNVSPDMVNQYMSPDVAFRQNAATQGLGQLYGNSGALRSTAAMGAISNANANIAAQAWNDAFGRASGVLGQNNNLALTQAQNMQSAKQAMAANSLANAMSDQGWLSNVGNLAGNLGQLAGGVAKFFPPTPAANKGG